MQGTLCSRVALLGPRHLPGQWLRHRSGNLCLALPQAWDVPPRAEPPLLQPPCSSSNAASRISPEFLFLEQPSTQTQPGQHCCGPGGPESCSQKGSQPQAPGMWGGAVLCSLLLLQGLWLWARLCVQSDSRQHQGKAEAGSQLGAMGLTEFVCTPTGLWPSQRRRGANSAFALKAESGSCWVSFRGASMHPHMGVQGQCCSGAVLA